VNVLRASTNVNASEWERDNPSARARAKVNTIVRGDGLIEEPVGPSDREVGL